MRGNPCFIITTTRFEGLAHEAAKGEGLSQVRIATVSHPIGGIAATELDARVEEAADAIVSLLRAR